MRPSLFDDFYARAQAADALCVKRRDFLTGALAAGMVLGHSSQVRAETSPTTKDATMTFKLPELPYSYDALQPYMSAETLQYHHDKHHNTYVETGNKLLEGSGLEGKSLEEIVKASFGKNQPLFNNAGQHYNHIHFWQWMKKDGGGTKIPGALKAKIDSDLGGFDKFREAFIEAGKGQFGSGWAWLTLKDGKLEVTKTANGENPLVHGGKPVLGVDVWEHSYYIDYRNLRPKYLEAFVDHLINWEYVEHMFSEAQKG